MTKVIRILLLLGLLIIASIAIEAQAATPRIEVLNVNEPPSVEIISPKDGSEFLKNDEITGVSDSVRTFIQEKLIKFS